LISELLFGGFGLPHRLSYLLQYTSWQLRWFEAQESAAVHFRYPKARPTGSLLFGVLVWRGLLGW